MSKLKIILISCKVLSGNTIYEMKVCLNIDSVFELFEIVVLAHFHEKYSQKSKKKLLYFYPLFVLEEEDHGTMSIMTLCINSYNAN